MAAEKTLWTQKSIVYIEKTSGYTIWLHKVVFRGRITSITCKLKTRTQKTQEIIPSQSGHGRGSNFGQYMH